MLKIVLAVFILLHAMIHLMGFAKAFQFAELKQLTLPISKPMGFIWLLTTLVFLMAIVLLFLNKAQWTVLAASAIILSQFLIILNWKDAKFGTIANVLILISIIMAWGSTHFENKYKKDVKTSMSLIDKSLNPVITEEDIKVLPEPVQRYLKYVGVINKPRVTNMRVKLRGEMRDKGKEFFEFESEQYNFMNEPTRLFFMKAKMFGVTVPGYHKYSESKASMDIRFFGLFKIVYHDGEVMDKAETVTVFNDMCILAPATLIDKRIKWEQIDNNTVKAQFTNHSITISAMLYFNEKGQLINFISKDRSAVSDMKQYPFSTPISSYKQIRGYNIFENAETVWQYPDGLFTYGKFHLVDIEYNVE